MNNQVFNQINLKIQLGIQNYNQSGLLAEYNQKIKQEAIRFVETIKPEIAELISKLSSRSIACNDIEEYLYSKRSEINLGFISAASLKDVDSDDVKNDILRLIASAIMNSYLDSLFKNQNSKRSVDTNLFLN